MDPVKIVLTSTGSLSQAITQAFALSGGSKKEIWILSRDLNRAEWLAQVGNVCASAQNHPTRFHGAELDWNQPQRIATTLADIAPDIVIHTASIQSMWSLQPGTHWAKLVAEQGYGITFPLQCKLAIDVGRALAQLPHVPTFINCSYPDVVNVVLHQIGLPVLSGIGNIGILELVLEAQLEGKPSLRMLANHYHVQQMIAPPGERHAYPRRWQDVEEVAEVKVLFDSVQLQNLPSLNHITAQTCLRLVHALVAKQDAHLHLAAPAGLPGGYPVTFAQGKIASIGTGKMDLQAEVEWNRTLLALEGVVIGDDRISFSEQAETALAAYSPDLAQGFSYQDAETYIDQFMALHDRLSSHSASKPLPQKAPGDKAYCLYEHHAWTKFMFPFLAPNTTRIPAQPQQSNQAILDQIPPGTEGFVFQINLTKTQSYFQDLDALVRSLEERGIQALNHRVTDISKSNIQKICRQLGLGTTRAHQEGDPGELLIVKTDLNYGGLPEQRMETAAAYAQLPLEKLQYPILPRREIAQEKWSDSSLIIERFIANPGNLFCRAYKFLDRLVISEVMDEKPIKKMPEGIPRTNSFCKLERMEIVSESGNQHAGLMRDIKAFATAMQLDYGAIDVVFDAQANPYIIDINTTPYWGGTGHQQVLDFLAGRD